MQHISPKIQSLVDLALNAALNKLADKPLLEEGMVLFTNRDKFDAAKVGSNSPFGALGSNPSFQRISGLTQIAAKGKQFARANQQEVGLFCYSQKIKLGSKTKHLIVMEAYDTPGNWKALLVQWYQPKKLFKKFSLVNDMEVYTDTAEIPKYLPQPVMDKKIFGG